MNKSLTIENINTAELIGVALKRMRKQRGIGQEELSKNIGIRQATISDIENGKGGNIDSMLKIIQFLQVNLVMSSDSSVLNRDGKPSSKLDFLLSSAMKNNE